MLESLAYFKKKKICVIGDFMLDSYTRGTVKRISPEAPVCVLKVKKQERLPGGAGNVALNCVALGASVFACGRLGDDFASNYLKEALNSAGIDTNCMIFEEGFETPLKNRFMAEYQQLLRVDFETEEPLSLASHELVLKKLRDSISDFDLILISDYNKGFLTRELLKQIIELANSFKIPVFVDPKGHDFTKYKGATLIKPNLSEAYLASGLDEKTSLDDVAFKLIKDSSCQHLLITRSEKGMSLFSQNGRKDFEAMAKEVIDVTGAGDTVLATLATSYASGIELDLCVKFANMAASCAIEKLGCVHVGKKELIKAITKQDTSSKYLPYISEDVIPLMFAGDKIKSYLINPDDLNFQLIREFSKLKNDNKDTLIAAIVADDCDFTIIKSLCDVTTIDLVVPESKRYLIKDFEETEDLLNV
jgi:D-glycero-beta-D-manno-heptose-7-phosphate kinase